MKKVKAFPVSDASALQNASSFTNDIINKLSMTVRALSAAERDNSISSNEKAALVKRLNAINSEVIKIGSQLDKLK